MQRLVLATMMCAFLAGCGGSGQVHPISVAAVGPPPPPKSDGWQAMLSAEDLDRLNGLRAIWQSALQAVPARYAGLVAREGDLLDAGAARVHPAPSPGSYRCRLVRLGAAQGKAPPVKSFADFVCYIRGESDGRLSFTKQTGSELPGGWLHADGDRRLVLVGARQKAVGDNSLAYGADPARDLVGVIERIGPFRWRLILPWREEKAGLDIYELTPLPVDRQVEEPRVPDLIARK